MSDAKVSQVQKVEDAWKKALADQAARVEGFYAEAARYEGQGVDQARTAIEQAAKLSTDTLAYWAELGAEWRKLSLEAARRTTEMFAPRVDSMLMPTPKDTLHRDGTASLYRFRRPDAGEASAGLPLVLVPSMINRWYVLDLRPGASMADALTRAGLDTFCLDWGIPEDEDRYLTWDDVIARLHRAVRAVKRFTGAPRVGVLGYCMGGTLSGIYSALHPDQVAALVNLAGPFDFSKAGFLGEMVDARYFDAEAVAAAGNVGALQMQSGFTTMRPTGQLAKWVSLIDKGFDPKAREAFEALEAWASDNIPFPGAAYRTYIEELYQQNLLVKGQHYVGGQRVDLGRIRCPVLTVVTDRDTICPPAAAAGLNQHCGSSDQQVLTVSGGHVGAVVGGKAPKVLYPAIAAWFRQKLGYEREVHSPANG